MKRACLGAKASEYFINFQVVVAASEKMGSKSTRLQQMRVFFPAAWVFCVAISLLSVCYWTMRSFPGLATSERNTAVLSQWDF